MVCHTGRVNDGRLVDPALQEGDREVDLALRPRTLEEYPGQQHVRENLAVLLDAARARNEPPDHVLLYGPPGLGKTTLAHIIAHELGRRIALTSGPAIVRPGDLAALLSRLGAGDVLFIDEVHRLPRPAEEVLYGAMEDFRVEVVVGQGMGANAVTLRLPRFTLVGATTRYALLSGPLRDRFGAVYRLDFYSEEELQAVLRRSCRLLDVRADEDALVELARRARGTPRVANRLLRRVRDYAQVRAGGVVTLAVTRDALAQLDVDELGLDRTDRAYLRALVETLDGGPAGIETLAAVLSEEPDTLIDVNESYLMRCGFVVRTPRGRAATQRAYEHLGAPWRAAQPGLFDQDDA